jgi:hypothetical protein
MPEILIISDVYVKKYTNINGAVDPNLLYPSIYLAQDKHLAPYLGTSLYEKIKSDIQNNTLAGAYQTLVEDYARRVVLWWSMVEAAPTLTYKVDNGTMVQRTSEDSQPVGDVIFKDQLARWQQNAEHYTGLMVDWLCANSSLLPEYSNNQWPQRPPITLQKGSASYIFSSGNTASSRTGYRYRSINQIP